MWGGGGPCTHIVIICFCPRVRGPYLCLPVHVCSRIRAPHSNGNIYLLLSQGETAHSNGDYLHSRVKGPHLNGDIYVLITTHTYNITTQR